MAFFLQYGVRSTACGKCMQLLLRGCYFWRYPRVPGGTVIAPLVHGTGSTTLRPQRSPVSVDIYTYSSPLEYITLHIHISPGHTAVFYIHAISGEGRAEVAALLWVWRTAEVPPVRSHPIGSNAGVYSTVICMYRCMSLPLFGFCSIMAKPHSGIVRSDSRPPNFTPLTHCLCAPGTMVTFRSSGARDHARDQ
jgi:hypothetical protein